LHARTKLRNAVRDRLIDANIAGGNVHTHDPRLIGKTELPLVIIESEMEKGIEVKGPPGSRIQIRTTNFSITVYAESTYGYDAEGTPNSVISDADDAADDLSEEVERAMLGTNKLFYKDSDGTPVRLGERDLTLIGTGAVRNPETGGRMVGVAHMLFEALLLTEEGNPSNTINR
jgi:hypothetical protein